MTEDTQHDTEDEPTTENMPLAEVSSYKVRGEFSDGSGAGVLGKNTAGSGTPIGVQGVVTNSDGYGLDTPNDARIEGALDTTGDLTVNVDGNRSLYLESDSGDDAGNVIAGNDGNIVDSSAVGATISGGGGLNPNRVFDNYGTVGGGIDNWAGTDDDDETSAQYATVAGGRGNNAKAFATTIAGGNNNDATESNATVAGGFNNKATDYRSAVGGGRGNEATGWSSVVSGGEYNKAEGYFSTIGGGGYSDNQNPETTSNVVYDNYGTIGGGVNNQVGTNDADPTSAEYATVPGGLKNEASGAYSFAAGRGGEAKDAGAFVWADNHTDGSGNTLAFGSNVSGGSVSGENSFNIRATGGARIVTDADSNGKPQAGVEVASGGGSWSSLSDADAKSNVSPVDPKGVLADVESLSISEWTYKSREDVQHMGPMAGEFHEAFGLGASEQHITNVDADGVAFAAIQGLSEKLDRKAERIDDLEEELEASDDRIDDLEAENEQLRAENEALNERLTAIESHLGFKQSGQPSPADD
jgi:FtsZ-binding cell division protein ZapB